MNEEFKGFPPPTKNFFSLPNEMVNIIAHIKNLAELKVIIYVMRHTWGYHEYGIYKTISVDEFMHGRKREDGSRMDQGTGLSNRSVIDGLRDAVQHGYLICDVDASDLARVKKSYALRMINRGELSSPHEDTSYSEDTTPRYEDTSHGYEESSQLGEDTSHRSEKYTTRKTLKKDTLERQVFDASASTPAPVTDLHAWKTDSEKRRAMFADVPLSQDIEEDISLLETRKQEATDPSQHTPAPGAAIPPSSDTGAQASRDGTYSTPAQRSGASLAGIPASPGAVQAGKRKGKVTQATDEPVPMPMPKSDTREIQRRINEHRGYALEEKVDIVRERQAIKTWCNLHTLEEYGLVMSGAKHDKYWGKQENYYRIGGLTLLKITPEILARQRQPLPMAANGNGHRPPAQTEGLVTNGELVWWDDQWMTEDQANETGFNGGFGLYK